MVRMEKGSANENAVRTLIAGMITALAILLGVDPAVRLYDQYIRAHPWMVAHVEIVPTEAEGAPSIIYSVDATIPVTGKWKAWVETQSQRMCWSNGTGNYGPGLLGEKSWTWRAFFESDCPPPQEAYQVCVSYDVVSNSGVPADFGPYCSEIFDPRVVTE